MTAAELVPITDREDVYATCTAAAQLLRSDGWTRSFMWRRPGGSVAGDYAPGMSMCVVGALRVATGETDLDEFIPGWYDCAATQAVVREAAARMGWTRPATAIGHVYEWNDTWAASGLDAIELLEAVAAKHQPDAYRHVPGDGP